ncbi:hypothetical protein [Treponema sp. R6D11]
MKQQTPDKCLCGALPIIEEKPDDSLGKVYKYKCPNCEQKELPFIGQWWDWGALQEWNRIAPKKSYRKRTLEYNESGSCIAEPTSIIEWKAKKGHDHLTIEIYEDNGRFYFGYSCSYKNSGAHSGLGIMDTGFPTMELLKKYIKKRIVKIINMDKEAKKIVDMLFPENIQQELF